jgi:signal transduction histidine kinase
VALVVLGLLGFIGVDARARREARRAKESRTALLAVVGHELRTPLTVILGYAQMLNGRWERIQDGKKEEIVQTIGRQARTLDRLIERLLYAGQLGRGATRNLLPRDLDLATVVDSTVELFAAESPLHTFEVDVERPLSANVDADATGRALGHLLENAVKYSPSGGRVWIRASGAGKRVRLVVEDEGVGLPADTSLIFEEFTQGQDVDTRVQDEGGVGLGLHIVRTLVTAMGGRVHAERREPNGARFVVSLPAGEGDRTRRQMVTSNHAS